MQTGFEVVAAAPKGVRAPEQPSTLPMRPKGKGQKAPSADQQRVRREMARTQRTAAVPAFTTPPPTTSAGPSACEECGSTNLVRHRDELGSYTKCHHCGADQSQGSTSVQHAAPTVRGGNGWTLATKEATQIGVDAWMLSPGSKIRGPNGTLLTVRKVEPHKTNMSAVNIHTDQGTISESPRQQSYHVVTDDQQQHELPGDTGFGGNTNTLPGGSRQDFGGGNRGFGHEFTPPAGAQKRNINGRTVWVDRNGQQISGAPGYETVQNAAPDALNRQRRAALDEHGGACPIDGTDLTHVGGGEHTCEEGHSLQLQHKDLDGSEHALGNGRGETSYALASRYQTGQTRTTAIASRAQSVLAATQEG